MKISIDRFEEVKRENEKILNEWLETPEGERRDDWYEILYLLQNAIACWNTIMARLKPVEKEKPKPRKEELRKTEKNKGGTEYISESREKHQESSSETQK